MARGIKFGRAPSRSIRPLRLQLYAHSSRRLPTSGWVPQEKQRPGRKPGGAGPLFGRGPCLGVEVTRLSRTGKSLKGGRNPCGLVATSIGRVRKSPAAHLALAIPQLDRAPLPPRLCNAPGGLVIGRFKLVRRGFNLSGRVQEIQPVLSQRSADAGSLDTTDTHVESRPASADHCPFFLSAQSLELLDDRCSCG